MSVTKTPGTYSFIGNSIIFELSDETSPISIQIIIGSESDWASYYPFKIGNQWHVRMNISDYLNFDSNANIPEGAIITLLQGFNLPYTIKFFRGEYKGNPILFDQFDGIALRGGISNQSFRKLWENGYDIFTYRLGSYFDQFLFTTRTNGKEIKLKKAELYPFVFIHFGLPITFRSESGTEIQTEAQPAGTICAMDIRAVLGEMPAGTKRIDVCPQGDYSFHFLIQEERKLEEKYLIRFRNSLGAFEMIEVTGRANHAPEFLNENSYETLTDFDFYEERRSRVKTKGVIEVETGYKERKDFPFIMDMIKSDEIYFLCPDGDSFRCHVTAESVQYRNFMTESTSIKLKIREVTEEEFSMPKIEFSDDSGIFYDTFDETFN
ncbi:MAG: hypothetical protein LBO74_16850 [Candidatus Symbiothrix sp.]|jgi:hypothetical protein|nr:hypothetical protein [Candidatus Symbiothrix sp.]